MSNRTSVLVTGIHIYRIGDHVHLAAEVNGEWRALCREHLQSNFSHIVEGAGVLGAPRCPPETHPAKAQPND